MSEMTRPITYLKGVGEKRAQLYKKLNIHTVQDLLYHFPRGYIDFTSPRPLSGIFNGETAVVEATIVKKLPCARIKRDFTIYKACAKDNNSETDLILTFFNQPYAFDSIKENESYYFYGKVSGAFLKREMNSPQIVKIDAKNLILPNYPLTANLSAKMLRSNVSNALELINNENIETLDSDIMEKYDICDLKSALKAIHFPKTMKDVELAATRLGFDELLCISLGLQMFKTKNKTESACKMYNTDISEFFENLPFEMTNAQKNAVSDIIYDMQKSTSMNRLLQGDVGSGKTAVAAACCYFAHKNGFQSALMAPTEILANQHYQTLEKFLSPLNVKVCLLTGSMTSAQKKQVKAQLLSGECSIAVGTHALIQESTKFCNLGFVITDEQHRFGVRQRSMLAKKGERPHSLFMSATPIPRTLSLIIYGDLDISLITERPSGRIPVNTYAVTGKMRNRVYEFIKKELRAKKSAYIVCPMIEDSESDLQSVCEYAEKIQKGAFAEFNVGLLHGKMTSAEKQSVMQDFKDGKVDVLVCTTVVEVGVDVPNATVIVIENAERFGLSQLHQLRGRVGRGSFESSCILICDSKTPEAIERMKILSANSDGFKISEEDLRLRGPGDFFGTRQHGLPELKIASLSGDMETVKRAQECANSILRDDKYLEKPENYALKCAVKALFEKNESA